jgi:hypothetical protein
MVRRSAADVGDGESKAWPIDCQPFIKEKVIELFYVEYKFNLRKSGNERRKGRGFYGTITVHAPSFNENGKDR